MTEAIAIPEPAALVPWSQMDEERRSLLRQICAASGLNDQQFALLCEVALRAGLDPFRKQIYGLILDGKFMLVTGIDGFRAVARRNGMAGIDEPRFEYIDPEKRIPSRCTITVYRHGPNGTREAYTATGMFREYVRYKKGGELQSMWAGKPHLMLAKCVEALALRMAFTETLGGLYEPAEFDAGPDTRSRVRQTDREPVSAQSILSPATEVEWAEMPQIMHDRVHGANVDPTDKDAP